MTNPPRRDRLRPIAWWIAIAAIAVATRWRWSQLVDVHTPYVGWDTQVFQQIAELPIGPGLVVSSKPLIVPLVFRAAHNDSLAIIHFQAELSFWAWALLTASVVLAVRRRWVRVLAACAGAAFVLDPTRVGLTGSLLPDSVNDSLSALCASGVVALVRLTGRARIAVASATGLVVLAWLFTRDTNAFIAVTAAALGMVIWRRWRSRAAWATSAATVILAAVVLWSARVAHDPLPYQPGWYRPFTARVWYPMLNNLLLRVHRDQPDVFPPAMHPFRDSMDLVLAGPETRPLQRWLIEHGSSIYARWLVRDPIARIMQVVRHRRSLLSADLSHYMPGNWSPPGSLSFRTLTSNAWLTLLLVIASPLWLLRPRRDPMCGAALCIAVSAVIGVLASYYGDATEVRRHCYGASQQLVLALFLALLAWLDRARWRTFGSPANEPEPPAASPSPSDQTALDPSTAARDART